MWSDISRHSSVESSLKVLLAIFCCYFVFAEFFLCTFRELGTSIFTMNNINKRKHGISKLEFISYVYGHNCVQSSFPAISKHIDKSSLKDTLQLKILRAILKNTTLYFRENYTNGIRELDVSWSYALLIPIEFSFHFGFLWYSITIPRIFGADSRFHMK